MMPTIDWSKPIEVYGYNTGETLADAKVLSSDLKGSHPYVIRFSFLDVPDTENVEACTPCGEIRLSMLRVRNKPVVRRKWAVLLVTKTGEIHLESRDTADAAETTKSFLVDFYKYVCGSVVELEWTEE